MTELNIAQTAAKLQSAQKIMITAHVNPDGDALGSSLGLQGALQRLGKQVDVFIDDKITQNYQILPGVEKIRRDYPKDAAYDLCVVLDCELVRTGRSAQFVAEKQLPVLNIDHHESNTKQADFLLLQPYSAATGEIVYSVIKALGELFNQAIATNIYIAIATDCGFFRYANTKSATMAAAAELLNYGVKPNKISESLEEKSLAELKAQAIIINSLEFANEHKIALATADKAMVDNCETTEGFVDIARTLRGVDISVFLKYLDDKLTRVSMRSKETNVAKVAESLGGGGHQRAAGCTLHQGLTEAKQTIAMALTQAMELEQNAD